MCSGDLLGTSDEVPRGNLRFPNFSSREGGQGGKNSNYTPVTPVTRISSNKVGYLADV